MGPYVSFLEEIGLSDIRQCGGKAANLGHLAAAGFPVPPGFCVRADAFDLFLEPGGLLSSVLEVLRGLDPGDAAAVESRVAAAGRLLAAAAVPPPVEEEIRRAYRELLKRRGGRARVAVRSSVGTRDLSATSFPGQMDTYHNIAGEDEVVDGVRRCWASAFGYRAVVSRAARGLDHAEVFVAPIVQLMVDSDTAGVVFTTDPVSGHADRMVVNACLGLGEGVVSGELDPDHQVIDRNTLQVIQERTGDKRVMFSLDPSGNGTARLPVEEERARAPCLDTGQLKRLVEAAARVEELYGCPQDIEWAFSAGELFILQSRAVTVPGRVHAPGGAEGPEEWVSEFDTSVDPRYPYYTLSNISEVLCGVLTPLTISGLSHLDYGFVKTNTDFGLMKGIAPKSEHTFLGIFYGRAHLNLSVARALTAKLPGASAQEFERMVPEGDPDWDYEGFRATPRAVLGVFGPLARILAKMFRTPGQVSRVRKRLEGRVAETRAIDFEGIDYRSFIENLRESRRYRSEVVALHIAASQFAVVFHDFLRKLTARWMDDPHGALASRLVTGLQNIESAGPALEIWELSRRVSASAELRSLFERCSPVELRDALLGDTPPAGQQGSATAAGPAAGDREPAVFDAFRKALSAFLGRYGYRSVFEAELMLPNWEDDPSFVFSMIQNYLSSGSGLDPSELADRQKRDREAAFGEAMAALGRLRRLVFRVLLSQAQRYIALREFTKATLIIGIARIKKEIHILSRRFAADGLIEQPEDLFFLTMDEVESLAAGRDLEAPTRELVSRRRAEYDRNKTVVLPGFSRGRPRPLGPQDLEIEGDFDELAGIPVSPGRVTGRARVITDPRRQSRMERGEILVAPVTDAAWTPLFVIASGIVVDVGGPLSHGSIVAREFGIPGVVNVGVGTKVIRDGQVVTVDGDRGKVVLHAPGGASPGRGQGTAGGARTGYTGDGPPHGPG